MAQQLRFGAELRRARLAADLTLSGFAATVHYSKGYLSRVETGRQQPTAQLALRCDAELGADGRLAALVPARPAGPAPTDRRAVRASDRDADASPCWPGLEPAMSEDPFAPRLLARRRMLAAGTAALAFGRGERRPPAAAAPVEAFGELFAQMRRMGQSTGSDLMLPILAVRLASRGGEGIRRRASARHPRRVRLDLHPGGPDRGRGVRLGQGRPAGSGCHRTVVAGAR